MQASHLIVLTCAAGGKAALRLAANMLLQHVHCPQINYRYPYTTGHVVFPMCTELYMDAFTTTGFSRPSSCPLLLEFAAVPIPRKPMLPTHIPPGPPVPERVVLVPPVLEAAARPRAVHVGAVHCALVVPGGRDTGYGIGRRLKNSHNLNYYLSAGLILPSLL